MRKIFLITMTLFMLVQSGRAQDRDTVSSVGLVDSALAVICQLDTPMLIDNTIRLKWQFNGADQPSFFVVERSTDEQSYQTIGVIRPKDEQQLFEYTDEEPLSARNYYRVRVDSVRGVPVYSPVVSAEGTGFVCKVYPNPVDRILIVKSEVNGEMQIKDGDNKSRIYQNVTKGLQSVDVSILEKGQYSIIVTDKETNKIYRERLAKD